MLERPQKETGVSSSMAYDFKSTVEENEKNINEPKNKKMKNT